MICALSFSKGQAISLSNNNSKLIQNVIKSSRRLFSNGALDSESHNTSEDYRKSSSEWKDKSERGQKPSGRLDIKNSRSMKAWQIHSYGGLEELQFTENSRMPIIKLPTDVLIKVHAASVNPIDLAMTKGYGSNTINIMRNVECGLGGLQDLLTFASSNKKDIIEFPLTMGRDYSGVVVEKGHGVSNLRIGDEVYGVVGVQRSGSHSEYVLAAEDSVKRKPSNLNFAEAASLPYVGLTSWAAIKFTGNFLNLASKKFLVLGGSGGVGTFAVQYLKSQGSHVVATCSQDAISLLERLGSDFVIDYRQADYLFQIQSFAPYDCILDLSGPVNLNKASDVTNCLKPLIGQYITLSPPFLSNIDKYGVVGGALKNVNEILLGNIKSFSNHRVPTKWAFFIPNGYALENLTHLVEREKIKPVIDEVFSLKDLPAAYKRVEDGHLRGKVVIEMQ